ncbi:MAG TPA: SulP family inorganic anion transporter [Casimicrobiaceae bacterium]|nr:SulP family inorganic anion transporter [Casimicrobiaceae bacterium]
MSPLALKIFPFLSWRRRVDRRTLRADVIAGLVSAVMVLPQGVAFATLAGMPPEYGLYGAMLPAIVGALWGSSWHLVSGPTNATSLMVFATVGELAAPFTPTYVSLVLTLNLMVGLTKLGLGVARLGSMVNFISTAVVIGFTAGAGFLIIGAQLRNFFGIDVPQEPSFFVGIAAFLGHLRGADPAALAVGVFTLVAALVGKRWFPRVPYMMTGIVAGALFALLATRFGWASVATIGALPSAIPPWSTPDFTWETWQTLAPLALGLTVIGLSEAISSARAVALRSGQRIDGNQEFIGQGLANVAGAFTSSYPTSGSFNRTGANYEAGARTPLACVFSAGLLLVILLLVKPLAAYLPVASMAAVLFIVARGLIDVDAMRRVWKTSRGDALTLIVTFIATLTIRLEVAILVGVLVSLLVYLNRTTHPQLARVLPDRETVARRFMRVAPGAPLCPQLDVLRVDGSLFFGAVEHLRDELETARRERAGIRHLLLVGSGINFIDAAGADLLVHEARTMRDAGITLHLCSLKPQVRDVLAQGGQLDEIGHDNIHRAKADALRAIYARLDSATCATCTARVFEECQVTLPDGSPRERPRPEFALQGR